MPRNREQQREHEHRVCLAACEMLSRIHQQRIAIIANPDRSDSTQPRCDFEAAGNGIHHVIEHTVIEAFPRRIASDLRFEEIFGKLEDETFANSFPVKGRFTLSCNSRESLLQPLDAMRARESLSLWVLAQAPQLASQVDFSPDADRDDGFAQISAQPQGVPCQVTLSCRASPNSEFLVSSIAPHDLPIQSLSRLETALARKCPKLAHWRQQHSTLVLEEADIALGSAGGTADNLKELLSNDRFGAPDYILYVDTFIRSRWKVHVLKSNERIGLFEVLVLDSSA